MRQTALNGWTGGQYSLYRALLGVALLIRFATPFTYERADWLATLVAPAGILPNVWTSLNSGWGVTLLLATGAVLSVLLAIGLGDRLVALPLSYLVATAFAAQRHGEAAWWLLSGVLWIHAATPAAPYGSWTARGRVDPGGEWEMPRAIQRAAWTAAALVYAYQGLGGAVAAGHGGGIGRALAPWLDARAEVALFPLCLAFVPLALIRPLRPWLWAGMLVVHLGGAAAGSGAWHTPMIAALGLLFDPAWIPARRGGTDRVFYDGGCGLCHGTVRFLLAEDGDARFRYAPLDGESFRARLEPAQRAGLPDSIVVLTSGGDLRVRSAAVGFLLARLGGIWRALGIALGVLPRGLADLGYDAIAGVRFRLFGQRKEWCPLVPDRLRGRFES